MKLNNAEELVLRAEKDCEEVFAHLARVERENFARVLAAFQEENVGAQHFAPSTGYGFDDMSRDTLCRVYARAGRGKRAGASADHLRHACAGRDALRPAAPRAEHAGRRGQTVRYAGERDRH